MKKTLALASAITAVGVSTIAGVGIASAHNNDTSGDSLADKISQRFNLDKTEVAKVIEADHKEHLANHQQRMQERLDQAVKDGKLTQDQADKLKAKMQELHDKMDALKDKSREERREAMKTYHDEFKQWAAENNIPSELLPGKVKMQLREGIPADSKQ